MLIFPLASDQTIAQMWSNGARGGPYFRSLVYNYFGSTTPTSCPILIPCWQILVGLKQHKSFGYPGCSYAWGSLRTLHAYCVAPSRDPKDFCCFSGVISSHRPYSEFGNTCQTPLHSLPQHVFESVGLVCSFATRSNSARYRPLNINTVKL